jgi:alpha-tubulin suppressor-like RCC1 family protein
VGTTHACGYINWAEVANCWGSDFYGQAGVDRNTAIYFPNTSIVMFAMPNQLGNAVARVSLGEDFTCADMTGGGVECFGYNVDGELGNGFTSSLTTQTFVPQSVGGGSILHGVSAGARHACALDGSGTVFCWGSDVYGQLGTGTAVSYSTFPAAITTTGAPSYRAVSAGRHHTCAIGTDNHIYCWGQNDYRQLGNYIYGGSPLHVLTSGYSPNPILTM